MGLLSFSKDPSDIEDLASEFRSLQVADAERLARFSLYRDELTASRNGDPARRSTGDYGRPETQGDIQRHQFNLPFGQALTVKHSFRIAGRLPDAVVDRREESVPERHRSDSMEKMWWGVTRDSNGDQQFASGSWDASQVGAACFQVYMDLKSQKPRYVAVDPAGMLIVKGLDDPHNFQRVYRFWQVPLRVLQGEYRNSLVDGEPVLVQDFQADPNGMVTVVQMTDRERMVKFALGFKGGGSLMSPAKNTPLERYQHNYGFVNYVVIPNLGPEREVWGWSDYEFVRDLLHYIPALLGREADIIRMVGNGAMMVKGSKLTPSAVKRLLQTGGVIPVGRDGDILPVQAPDVPNFESEHAERVMEYMRDLGFAPKAAWGSGDAGSGSDRGLQLGPMLELTSMKQINWSAGLSRLASMVFRMIEGKQARKARFTGVRRSGFQAKPFNASFGPDEQPIAQEGFEGLLPMDPKEIFDGDYSMRFSWPTRLDPDDPAYVASELQKFTAGVQSARTTLERFGVEAPEDELKLIEQENEDHPWLRQGMLKLVEMQLGQSQQGANDGSQNQPDPMGGSASMEDTSALDADVMSQGLGGGGTLYGKA